MLWVIKIIQFIIIQSAMQFNKNQDTKKKKEKKEKKGPDILGIVKKMMDGFMIKGNRTSMQWMLDQQAYKLKIYYNTTAQGQMNWVKNQI